VKGSLWRITWWRFRTTFGQRRAGYLAIIVVVALVGGLSMASVAAARRTQSAFPRLLAASNPSNLAVDPGRYTVQGLNAIAHLPLVASTKTYVAIGALRAQSNGFANLMDPFNQKVELVGSLDGLYFNQDRLSIVRGRAANLEHIDEAIVSQQMAREFKLHVNQRLTLNLYSVAQQNDQNFNPTTDAPLRRERIRITGIGVFTDEVVQDDVDRIDRILVTPAFTRQALDCCATYMWTGLKLRHGNADVAKVQREFINLLPPGSPEYFRVTSVVEAQGERAVRPESLAVGLFGIIAALALLVLTSQTIRRQIYSYHYERSVLRALGADPIVSTIDSSFGALVAIIVGSLLAAGTAIALSPIAPLGPIHRLEVNPGISFDWMVLGLGMAAMVLTLGGVTAFIALQQSPQRLSGRNQRGAVASGVVSAAVGSGLPVSAVTGIRFALEPGSGRNPVPVRSSIVSTALALLVLVGALTFGASLKSLVSNPTLYGWNWDKMLEAGSGYGEIPPSSAARLLNNDHFVAAWSSIYFDGMEIDGQNVPVIAMQPHADPAPPILSGHGLSSNGQIVLGANTLAALHKNVGDLVYVRSSGERQVMRIVGTATLPTIGIGHGVHPSLGDGAIVPIGSLPHGFLSKSLRGHGGHGTLGPNAILVRFRSGADEAAATIRLNQIATTLSQLSSLGVSTYSVQRPAEIVNYRAMGTAPAILGGGLAGAAALALALTLATSVRHRARDLAILKSLGFTRRQMAMTVLWQSTVSVVMGTLIGVPLGIVAGRILWTEFAKELHVVPQSVVPVPTIALVVVLAVILANLVAAGPGRRAANTPVALVLRGE
jgi:hypothetical protein